jgi:MFS family permease
LLSKGAGDPIPKTAPPMTDCTVPLRWRFVAFDAIANLGAYIAFIPLLQILVPLRATAIDPAHAALLLSRVSFCGAVTASLGNLGWGALSDRTLRHTGGRRPWLLCGLAGILVSYGLIGRAASPGALLGAVIVFQLAFNAMFAPLGAILADRVPAARRGLMSALLGLGYPLGNLIGTQTIGYAIVGQTQRFVILGLLVGMCILPFAALLRPDTPSLAKDAPWRDVLRMNPFRHRNFSTALASRVLIMTAFSLVQGYLFLYLQQIAALHGRIPGRPEAAFAKLAALATAANVVCAVIGGAASDRLHRRSWFVCASAMVMSTGIVMLAGAGTWAGLEAGSLIYGCGAGVFYAVDLALIVQVLPSLQYAGKDLGIINLSNTLPQAIAPLLALALLEGTGSSFHALFLCAAASAMMGGLCVLRISGR